MISERRLSFLQKKEGPNDLKQKDSFYFTNKLSIPSMMESMYLESPFIRVSYDQVWVSFISSPLTRILPQEKYRS